MEGLEFLEVLFFKLIFNEFVIALLRRSNSCYSVFYWMMLLLFYMDVELRYPKGRNDI